MKRFLLIAVAVATCLCGYAQKKEAKSMTNEKKVLVAFFSATGKTKAVAERLAKAIKADIYEITPEIPYTEADLDWREKKSRSTIEMQDQNSRPKIKGKVQDMDKYNVVYIGFPIWWNVCPRIVNTFIESYDFKGKSLVPFATSGSSPIDNSCKDMRTKYPTLNWEEGKLLNSASDKTIEDWVK